MSSRKRRYRILVSDREKNTRDALTEIFSGAGYNVDAAGSGSETIEKLARQAYDLVFCDLDLPRTSGTEIVRMARALNRDARIVVTSSSGELGQRSRIRREGAYEVLDKPLRKTKLLAVARRALSGAPQQQDAVGTADDGGDRERPLSA